MDPRRIVNAVAAAFAISGVATPIPAGSQPSGSEPRPYCDVVAESGPSAAPTLDRVEGGVQVFDWSPGRVYAVRTAPLRVTTLTLAPGETLMTRAAGDTVRWRLGEARSGAGTAARTHVLVKPLERGLQTNLVLTTDQRVYLVALSSGRVERFNPAVRWEIPAPLTTPETIEPVVTATPAASASAAEAEGPLDARYRIDVRGRRPAWTPSAVFDDGRRTFIAFPAGVSATDAPALFAIGPDGEAQFVNYRQINGLYVADRLFERAELRLGDRRRQVVRIRRLAGDPR